MKKKKGDDWFPFWIDKWIFGSTRDELTIEQCAIWVDFLALSYKDNGYIRANEGIPYPIKRLSGLLGRPEKLIQQTIDRCLDPKVNKLRLEPDGTLYVLSHPEYALSGRHKRRLSENNVRKNGHDGQKTDAKNRIEKNRIEKNRIEKNRIEKKKKKKIDNPFEIEFEVFWKAWPREARLNKQYAKGIFIARCKQGLLLLIQKCFRGYMNFLLHKKVHENFEQKVMYPSTFLNKGRFKEYEHCKYKPPM